MKFMQRDDSAIRTPQTFLHNKRKTNFIILVFIILITYLAGRLLEFDWINIFVRFPFAAKRFATLYFPPNFKEINKMLEAIWVTVVLAITAATLGVVLAYLCAIGMSKVTGKIKPLRVILRFIATFLRNVPSSIWAIILLMAFWFGEFLALLVMTIGTFGFMARVFSDMIDETNSNSIEALEATGASYWQIITQAVFPETLPVAISWALYAVENNIRSATIIGMLAGGGIGYLTGIYKHFRRFDELLAATIFIVAITLIADRLSVEVRKRIL